MKKRICALLLAALMIVGMMPAFSQPASAADSTGTVVLDWNCDMISAVGRAGGNSYPDFYILDSTSENGREAGVPSGTVKFGGTAATQGYAILTIPNKMTTAAFTLDIQMKVESLVTLSSSPMWAGFVIDFDLPGGKNIYISIRDLDGTDDDTTAVIGVSKETRGDAGHTAEFVVPSDDNFHRWTFQYDGSDVLRFAIDGEVIKDFTGVNIPLSGTAGKLVLKNNDLYMVKDSVPNALTIDSIKLTEGTILRYNEIQNVTVAPTSTSSNFCVNVASKYVADTEPKVTVKVHPRGDKSRTEENSVPQTSVNTAVTLSALPFSGICTVTVECSEAQPYEFDYYIYSSQETLSAGAVRTATAVNQAYTFSDFSAVELPAGSAWYKANYIPADGLGTQPTDASPAALFIPKTDGVYGFSLPVTLTGKFAVYVGYVEGTQYVNVNGKEVKLSASATASNTVKEAYATAVNLNGGTLTIANTANALAKIAYVKFVSLSDEQYTLALKTDDSHTLITDNDGFSTLTNAEKGDFNTLYTRDFANKSKAIDQRQFIWCTFSTSILNYNSQAWWDHVNARMAELGIENNLEHYLDHVVVEGEGENLVVTYPDFTHKMRIGDQNAYNNILKLNPTEPTGVNNIEESLHAQLATAVKTNNVGDEFYVSLRMSHFSAPGSQYEFQSGSYYRLHQDWRRVSKYENGQPVYQTQLSYYYEGYRQYLHDILMEMAAPAYVDGLLLDFGRYYLIFGEECPSVEERTEIMNEFVKDLRDDLNAAFPGKKLTVRVLDPIPDKATAWGLDYQTWVENGWVDRVYISCQSHETFFDFQEYIDFFAQYPDVEFYLGVNATLSGHDTTKAEEAFMQAGGTIQKGERVDETTVMLRVYDFYHAGADGVFMFNWSSGNEMFKNMNNATLMEQWYNFSYPAMLQPSFPARFKEEGTVFVESVTMEAPEILSLEAGRTASFSATVMPVNASNATLKVSSSNPAAATVSVKNGVVTVTAVETGTATISVTSVDGEITDTAEVQVYVIPVEGIMVDKTEVTVGVGYTAAVTATILPLNASRQGVVWTSDNDQIAIVDNGVITGLAEGTTTIVARSLEGGLTGEIKATVAVTVQRVPVSGVLLDQDALTIRAGESATVYATVLPADAFNKVISWKSSDETVVTVSDAGVYESEADVTVETLAMGNLTVPHPVPDYNIQGWESAAAGTASATYRYDAGTDVLTLNVTYIYDKWIGDFALTDLAGNEITGHDFTKYGATGDAGTLWKGTLTVNISDMEMLKDLVIWVSSTGTQNDKLARLTIDLPETLASTATDMKLSALKPGTAKVTVTTADGGHTDTVQVTVTAPAVAGMTLDKETAALTKGESTTVTATIIPADAGNKAVLWTVNDPAIAAVTDTSTYTGKAVVTTEGKGIRPETLPVSDADWAIAAAPASAAKAAEVAYVYDAAAQTLTLQVTHDFGFWVLDAAITDAAGNSLAYTADRTFGTGGTLWSFYYTDTDPKPNAVKAVTFTVTDVAELPETLTLFVSNTGTGTEYTAKISMNFAGTAQVVVPSAKITALKPGGTVVTATTAEGGFTKTVTVTVAVPTSGSISGSAVSKNSDDNAQYLLYADTVADSAIIAEWTAGGANTALFAAEKGAITGDAAKTQTFTFKNVPNGTYKLAILKSKHVPAILSVTVYGDDVKLAPQTLYMYGDVTGDGAITNADAEQIGKYAVRKASVFDLVSDAEKAILLTAADVNRDGKVNASDMTQILRYVAGKSCALDAMP